MPLDKMAAGGGDIPPCDKCPRLYLFSVVVRSCMSVGCILRCVFGSSWGIELPLLGARSKAEEAISVRTVAKGSVG